MRNKKKSLRFATLTCILMRSSHLLPSLENLRIQEDKILKNMKDSLQLDKNYAMKRRNLLKINWKKV